MTSSNGSDRKSPPGPIKIHRFERRASRPQDGVRRGRETLELERPTLPEFSVTLPEFSLEPRKGGAAAAPPVTQPPPRSKAIATTPPPVRGAPPPPEPRRPDRDSSPVKEDAAPAAAPAPKGLLAEQMATARQLFSQGQLSQARDVLDKLVARGVGGAPARTLLGTILMAQGSMDRALACFEAALEEDPAELTARLSRGEIRLGWGELLLAQEDLHYVLEAATAGSPVVQQARRLLQRLDELRERKRR